MPVELFIVDIVLICSAMSVKLEASHYDLLLLHGQELCLRRSVRHEEKADDSVDNRDSTFNEENPIRVSHRSDHGSVGPYHGHLL